VVTDIVSETSHVTVRTGTSVRAYFGWQLTPEPDPWLDRVLLITYPELYICSKAGECATRWRECCPHRTRHVHLANCQEPECKAIHATCIPYVPEDEARDWFVVAKDTGAWVDGSGLLDTKERALELIRARQRHNLRAFKWSDGLKGGE
jgi:hypothetical protein